VKEEGEEARGEKGRIRKDEKASSKEASRGSAGRLDLGNTRQKEDAEVGCRRGGATVTRGMVA